MTGMQKRNLKKNFLGHIPGPYGVDLAVYRDPNDAEEFYHDFDSCMNMAGIYHRRDRNACRNAADEFKGRGSIPFSIFLDNGGQTVPKEKIGGPKDAIYPSLPTNEAPDIPIENWVTAVMDVQNWRDRAKTLDGIFASNFEQSKDWHLPPGIQGFSLQLLLTASLEHLHETEIDCLEAAATYALSVHNEWSNAGVRWIEPFKATWFRDWVKKHPGYATMAKACCCGNPDLPKWLCGGERHA